MGQYEDQDVPTWDPDRDGDKGMLWSEKGCHQEGLIWASATLYLGSVQIFCQQVYTDTSIPEYSTLLWDTLPSVFLRTCKM